MKCINSVSAAACGVCVAMRARVWWLCALGVALGVPACVLGTAEVMSHVTAHFGKSLEDCREEAGLTREQMGAFQEFWAADYEVSARALGCAILCMSHRFRLLQDDARMHHENMHDYVKSFPQGELLSTRMVQLIHACEREHDAERDECERVVRVAACFKRSARAAGIAPEIAMIEAVLEEY